MHGHRVGGISRRIGSGLQLALPLFILSVSACGLGSAYLPAASLAQTAEVYQPMEDSRAKLGLSVEVVDNPVTETWHCPEDGSTIIINHYKRTVEVIVPRMSCDILIVDGARGTLGGECAFLGEDPLLQYRQWVKFMDNPSSVWWGFDALALGKFNVPKASALFILGEKIGTVSYGKVFMDLIGQGSSVLPCHH
jgi:hypothetical protein